MANAVPGSGAVADDVAALAHDLANVIAVLSGSAAMLEGDLDALPATHPAREQAARIALAATRAGELCERMRLPAAIVSATGRHVAKSQRPATHDLAASVREACDLIAPALPGGCTLVHDTAAPVRVAGAALDAFQVVLNLALNAGEASDGPVRLAVEAVVAGRERPLLGRLVPGRRYARLVVEDDGPGMPNNAAPLFERGTTGSGDAGRGTGLATVAAIAEGAGGAVRVGRSASGGTRVEVWWPEAAATPDVAGCHVLIVAGRSGPTARAADALEAAGAEPSLCLDPLDAVASVAEDRGAWDAIVVAGGAGGIEAAEIARRLTEADPGLPVLALTDGPADAAHTLAPDASAFNIVRALGTMLAADVRDGAVA